MCGGFMAEPHSRNVFGNCRIAHIAEELVGHAESERKNSAAATDRRRRNGARPRRPEATQKQESQTPY